MNANWAVHADQPELKENEVHVWRISLNSSVRNVLSLSGLLSEDESYRAGRFLSAEHGNRFRAARGTMRQLLGRYLDAAPETLEFAYGPCGKPSLAGHFAQSGLYFNISHSHRLALCAVTRDREVGIDLEWLRSGVDVESLAQRFFSPLEVASLRRLTRCQRVEGFYRCWTRKEAYLKARGQGITVPLDSFAVSLAPNEPAQFLYCQGDPDELSRWQLQDLTPAAGYAAAICVQGANWTFCCWTWPEQ